MRRRSRRAARTRRARVGDDVGFGAAAAGGATCRSRCSQCALTALVSLARPARDELDHAATRRHGDPRVRRVEQHGCRRPRTHAHRSSQGRGPRRSSSSSHRPIRSASWLSATAQSSCRNRPTTQADVIAAIDRLSVEGGTSLGQGLFAALSAIAGKPLDDRRGRARQRPRRGRHRILRVVDDRVVVRRREQRPARPARRCRDRVGRRRAAFTPSASAPSRARWSTSADSTWPPRSTARCSRKWPR